MGSVAVLTDFTQAIVSAQLLTDGSILAVGASGQSWRIFPNEYGSYTSPRIQSVNTAPGTQLYSSVHIGNDGQFISHGSEFGTGSGRNYIFDPATNGWVDQGLATQGLHRSVWQWTNGDFTCSAIKMRKDYTDRVLLGATILDTELEENGQVLQPDNSRVCFGKSSRYVYHVPDSNYDAEPQFTFTQVDLQPQLRLLPRPFQFERLSTAANDGWKSWGEPGVLGNPNIDYENGVQIYMPLIGRTVMVSGRGQIITYDKTTQTVNRPFMLPMMSTASLPNLAQWSAVAARMDTTDRALRASYVTAFTFTWDTNASAGIRSQFDGSTETEADPYWLVNPSGTKWTRVKLDLTTFVDLGSGRFQVEVKSDNRTDVPTGKYPNSVENYPIGSCLTQFPPQFEARDQAGALLPNGHLLFGAGLALGGFPVFSRLMQWNGSTEPTFVTDRELSGIASQFVCCPDGNVMLFNGAELDIFLSTPAEKTPNEAWRPLPGPIPQLLAPSCVVTITGTRLNGVHVGSAMNDELSNHSHFPLLRLTNKGDNRAHFARTLDFNYRGISPTTSSTFTAILPASLPFGEYSAEVVASGIASAPQTVYVTDASGQFESTPRGVQAFMNFYK